MSGLSMLMTGMKYMNPQPHLPTVKLHSVSFFYPGARFRETEPQELPHDTTNEPCLVERTTFPLHKTQQPEDTKTSMPTMSLKFFPKTPSTTIDLKGEKYRKCVPHVVILHWS